MATRKMDSAALRPSASGAPFAVFSRALRRQGILQKKATVVLGVSGGLDSMALASLMLDVPEAERPTIIVAHLNHASRGQASDRDQAFVTSWAARRGLVCVARKAGIAEVKKTGSREDRWRQMRMRFFRSVSRQHGADAVLLAHHADDQVETILMRMFRGTGAEGLGGMRTDVRFRGIRIVRPLLDVRRADLEDYVRARNISYVNDESNRSRAFFRNRIRHDILPELKKKVGPGVVSRLVTMTRIVQENAEFLGSYVEKRWRDLLREETGRYVAFHLPRLLSEHPSIRYLVIKRAAEALAGLRQIDYAHGEKIQRLFDDRDAPVVNLPKNVCVTRERDAIVVRRVGSVKAQPARKVDMDKPCDLGWQGRTFTCRKISPARARKLLKRYADNPWKEIVDGDRVRFPLEIRTREPGDRFRPLGRAKRGKLKDFFSRQRVPSRKSQTWPLVLSEGEIIWIPGLRVSDIVKVTKKSRGYLEFSALD